MSNLNFGSVILNWLKDQPDLEFLLPCCWSDQVIYFVRRENDLHVACVIHTTADAGGKFHFKIDHPTEDDWDDGTRLSIAEPDFFIRLHELLVKLDQR